MKVREWFRVKTQKALENTAIPRVSYREICHHPHQLRRKKVAEDGPGLRYKVRCAVEDRG